MRLIKKYPLITFIYDSLIHPSPINLTYFWNFGIFSFLCLIIQIITGVALAMHYVPNIELAFTSVEHIMRDVNYGWLLRYLHANGASMFFIVVYIHTFRGLYFGSYNYPRELLWGVGVIILLLMILTAFIGYVLPWGQMSFWGATVITNLASTIPFVGLEVVYWLWGGFSVDNATLNKFFSLHYLFPFIIVGLVAIHLLLLHEYGSNNPIGIYFFLDYIPLYPYYIIKDLYSVFLFFIFFGLFVYFTPNLLGHPDNYIEANPAVTPEHIVPEWYFLPFYAILRSVPSKFGGVVLLLCAIIVLLILPFFVTNQTRSASFRPAYRLFFWFFFVVCLELGWIGGKPIEIPYLQVGQLLTVEYFVYFLIILPFIVKFEKFIWDYNR